MCVLDTVLQIDMRTRHPGCLLLHQWGCLLLPIVMVLTSTADINIALLQCPLLQCMVPLHLLLRTTWLLPRLPITLQQQRTVLLRVILLHTDLVVPACFHLRPHMRMHMGMGMGMGMDMDMDMGMDMGIDTGMDMDPGTQVTWTR